MACVNVPGQALAPISRLMARVWGNSGENHPANMYKESKMAFAKPKSSDTAEVEAKPEPSKPEKSTATRRTKEVRIDATTMVPTDLYWSMLREGERAKNGGQHRLRERSSHGWSDSPRPHLVRTN
mmetsp:Transcript_79980/g.192011  ORF Transcript_79980/g.192011 Transcript_79980/m.192011 type:complete len:125 (+) Transcript_79980:99-473(+)